MHTTRTKMTKQPCNNKLQSQFLMYINAIDVRTFSGRHEQGTLAATTGLEQTFKRLMMRAITDRKSSLCPGLYTFREQGFHQHS